MDITSVNNPLVKDAVKLQQKKYRDLFNLFVVEGYHLYEEASKFNIIKYIFTTDKTIKGDNVYYVTNQVLTKLAKTKHLKRFFVFVIKLKKKNFQIKS